MESQYNSDHAAAFARGWDTRNHPDVGLWVRGEDGKLRRLMLYTKEVVIEKMRAAFQAGLECADPWRVSAFDDWLAENGELFDLQPTEVGEELGKRCRPSDPSDR